MSSIQSVIAVLVEAAKTIDFSKYGTADETYIEFIHMFDNVPDFRQKAKVTYNFGDLLCLCFLAIARSEKNVSCLGIYDHLYVYQEDYKRLGLIKEDGKIPSHDTIRRVLMSITPGEMEKELTVSLNSILEKIASMDKGGYRHVSVDGKEVKGSGRAKTEDKDGLRNIQVLNLYNNSTCVCMHSETIEEKTNEIPVAQRLLGAMELRKVVVTFDALHTQRETCTIIADRKGYYVAPVKENQKGLLDDMMAKFDKSGDKSLKISQNGRDFEFLEKPKGYSCDGFKGLKTFVKMESHKGRKPLTMYFITNLSIKKTDLIMESVESRWEIETFHKHKDGMLNEDTIVLTSRTAVLNIAIMNNFAVAAAMLYGAMTGEETRISKKRMKAHPEQVVSYLLRALGSKELVKKIEETVHSPKRKRETQSKA